METVAAVTGLYFLFTRKLKFVTKLFIYLLCLTVLVEIIATYSPIAYFSEYQFFGFVKDTSFVRNYWIYNIRMIIAYFVYTYYFRSYLKDQQSKKLLMVLLMVFVVTAIVNLFSSDVFFTSFSAYSNITGSLLALLAIALYYYQFVNSDAILDVKKHLPVYISIGAMLLYFVLTPIFIYSRYFDIKENPDFVELYKTLLVVTNVLVYLIYTIGFIVCLRKNDS